ncbi:unnamed protein product [Gongylonema pulchrum]|uniref:Carboxylesterase type B domain-containing protein n=1 Tax=Gongylonema pulchrum TaxID=637853 RepID=A0A3P7QHW3_9BILA|nr:unnamed protein product [Gongylonema pulchrum]
MFLPTVDGRIVPANPRWLLDSVPSGNVDYPSPVPYLTGLNRDDGSEVILEDRLLGEFNDFLLVDQQYLKSYVLEYAFRHNYTTNREAIAEAIEDRYTYWPDASDENAIRKHFIHTEHLHITNGDVEWLHLGKADLFFSVCAPHSIFQWSVVFKKDYEHLTSVCHDCDLYLLFGFPFMPKELLPKQLQNVTWTGADRNASQIFSLIFRQFASFMNPNLPSDSSWLAFEPRRHWYMNFNYSTYNAISIPGTLERDYRWELVSFWNIYLPSLVQYMTTTFSPFEVKIRRELVAYQMATGVIVCILMVALVLMCLFAYLLFERNSKLSRNEFDCKQLIRNTDGGFPPRHISQVSCL